MNYYFKPNRNNYAGFCATLNNSINVCLQYHKMFDNYELVLDVPELNQIFDFKNQNLKNLNAFLYKQKFHELPKEVDIISFINFEPTWRNSNFDNSSNAHTVCDIEKVRQKNKIFNNFFTYKNLEIFEEESKKFINDKTLGIQIRGTDKTSEVNAPDVNNILNKIKSMLEKHDIDNIYLATDDQYYKDLVLNEFGGIVKTRDVTISLDRRPIHFIDDRTNINLEVMTDVYLLSKCNYFLYCFSNVSYSALVLGVNDFKDIDCVNI